VTGHLLTPTVVADHRANGVYTVPRAKRILASGSPQCLRRSFDRRLPQR
jgi:hypothetical protein